MKTFTSFILLVLVSASAWTQTSNSLNEFTFDEYIGYVKKFHPLVKQANLKISEAQATLMMSRGAFDPKVEVDFSEKQFKDKTYYSFLNSSFKIPTWYGIEIKAAFDNNEGMYINPENTIPNQGLTSLGISVPIGQGLFINKRMADVRQAKLMQTLNAAERDLLAVNIIYDATVSYINWKRNFDEVKLYEAYLENATLRQKGIIKLIAEGDKPAIDSVEAGIIVKTRWLNLEESKLKLSKARLELSNYLWLENNVPLELNENLKPESNLKKTLNTALNQTQISPVAIENHPKIKALNTKIEILKIEQKLKANALLPKLDLSYNYLSEPDYFTNYRFEDYKIGANFSFPIFLRKERAGLKLSKIKVEDSKLNLIFEKKQLENKIAAQIQEVNSVEKQMEINQQLVTDYTKMLDGEDRLFEIGESSVFVINSRENALVAAKITQIALENRFLNAISNYYKILANINF
jgi:outer membrane protein TolC